VQGKAARRQAADKERLRAQRERSRSQGEPALAVGVTGGGFAGTDEDGEEQRRHETSEASGERQGQRDARAGEPRLLSCPSPLSLACRR